MQNQSAIKAKLAVLAAQDSVFSDGQRVISHDLPPLAAILREIDDTVLERTLVFGIGTTRVFAVVAGRRLRGIVEIADGTPTHPNVVGQVIARDEPDTIEAVGKVLKNLCADNPAITVYSIAVRQIGSHAEAGVSATALARAWGVDLDAKPASPLTRFIAANSARITSSYVVTADQSIETTGDAAVLATIWDTQVGPFRERHDRLLGKQDRPILIGLDDAQDGQSLAVVLTNDGQGLLTCAAADLPPLIQAWNAITAG